MVGNLTQLFKIQGAATAIAEIIYAPVVQTFEGTEKPKTTDSVATDDEVQLEINAATFAYPTKKEIPVLQNINLKVPKNNIVALVGASGCGKSSIISLVERYYDPAAGKFSYNGKDLQSLDNTWYHQTQVALVQQEPILFSNSIRENICYGVDFKDKTKEEIDAIIDQACKDAFCYDFI